MMPHSLPDRAQLRVPPGSGSPTAWGSSQPPPGLLWAQERSYPFGVLPLALILNPQMFPDVPCLKWDTLHSETETLPPWVCVWGGGGGGREVGYSAWISGLTPQAPRTRHHHWGPTSPASAALTFNHLRRVRVLVVSCQMQEQACSWQCADHMAPDRPGP